MGGVSIGPAPLVAAVKDSTTWHTGTGVLDYALTAVADIGNGDLLGAGLNAGAAALGTLGAIVDPLQLLISAGVGWCLEHVAPLRDCLDWLAGKPDVIASFAQTWERIGERLNEVAERLTASVHQDTAGWTSAAIDAYRMVALDQIAHVKAAGVAAGGIGTATALAGVMVATVRATVRDLVAEAVGMIISKAVQAVGVVTIPKVVVEIGMIVTSWSLRILARIKELIAALARLTHATSRLVPVLQSVETAALKTTQIHTGRLVAWIDTTVTSTPKPTGHTVQAGSTKDKAVAVLEDLPLYRAARDIRKSYQAAGHGTRPVPILGANLTTTVTNPSHIGLDLDESRKANGRPLVDLEL